MNETLLGNVDKPIAVGDARLTNAMSLRQLDLGDVPAYSARHHHTAETSQDGNRRFACDDNDGPNDGAKIGVPDLAARDHSIASPARTAAASSICASSAVTGVCM